MAIALIVAFSLGIIAQRSGLIDSIGKYRGDIVFLDQMTAVGKQLRHVSPPRFPRAGG